ncbi:hypothetical protein QAD02_024132 [Eretmocerus hayati]|uniref:Uncharacterized protein n=1 Tax=Eretmocerus hayati TaxID=131215 RepID=A0ACC2PY69_9HYME|nr:hypothetical protein QAD02_024132 [Eretmocerus hayati]
MVFYWEGNVKIRAVTPEIFQSGETQPIAISTSQMIPNPTCTSSHEKLAAGPPVQLEPVDLSLKTPVVLQVPRYSPAALMAAAVANAAAAAAAMQACTRKQHQQHRQLPSPDQAEKNDDSVRANGDEGVKNCHQHLNDEWLVTV